MVENTEECETKAPISDLNTLFRKYHVDARTRRILSDHYGSLEALAEAIKQKIPRTRWDGTQYFQTGWFWASCRVGGVGRKTAISLVSLALLERAVTFEDCDFDGSRPELKHRIQLNTILRSHGWQGPFLPERLRDLTRDSAIKKKREQLMARRARLSADLVKVETEIAGLDVEK